MAVAAAKPVSKGLIKFVAKHLGVDALIRPAKEVIAEATEAAAKKAGRSGAKNASEQAAKEAAARAAQNASRKAGSQTAEGAAKKGAKNTPAVKKSAAKPGVEVGQTGSYRDLSGKAKPHDRMQHDHIPSSASLKEHAKRRNPNISDQTLDRIHRDAPTIAVPQAWHQKFSRTYGDSALFRGDANDLLRAARRDVAAYSDELRKLGWDQVEIDDFFVPQLRAVEDFLKTEWWK